MQGKGTAFIGGNQGRPLSKGDTQGESEVWEQDIYMPGDLSFFMERSCVTCRNPEKTNLLPNLPPANFPHSVSCTVSPSK